MRGLAVMTNPVRYPTGARDNAMLDRTEACVQRSPELGINIHPSRLEIAPPLAHIFGLSLPYFMMEGSIDTAYLGIGFWDRPRCKISAG